MKNSSKSTIRQRHEIDWGNDDEIVEYVRSRWENKDYYKRSLERKWLEIIAAYEGMTYANYDTISRRLTNEFKIPAWRVRLVINLMLPYVRNSAARLLRNRPIFDVLPATTDSEDYDIASAGKKYLRGFWYQNNINYTFIDLLLWLGLTGNSYLAVNWNPDIGPQLELEIRDFINQDLVSNIILKAQQTGDEDPTELQIALQDASQKFEKFVQANNSNLMSLGDNELKSISPFDMLTPFAPSFYSADWYVVSELNNISKYHDLGIDTDELERPSQKDARYAFYSQRIENLQFIGDTGDYVDVDDKNILELKLWLPKSRQFPRGYTCSIAGGKLIHKGENPYNHTLVPLIQFGAERTPGKVHHTCAAEYALPILRQYQKTKSQIVEIKNLMSKPKWLVSRAANISDTAITSEPGEVIEYSGLEKPEAWSPPAIPRYLFDLMSQDRFDMDEIMATRDASKGINPSGSRSATMLANLQSQDDGQLSIVSLNLDTGFSIVGRMLLSNAAQFIKENRLVTYTGEKNRYETVALSKGSLVGKNSQLIGADYYNVRVTSFSQFGLTRIGQIEVLKSLLQYNIFTPNDRPKILQFIQMGYFEDEIDEYKKDRANAHKENLMLIRGMPVEPDISEHGPTHLEEHEDFMKGELYQKANPQIKMLFRNHALKTKLLVVAKAIEPNLLMIPAQMLILSELQQQLGINANALIGAMKNVGRTEQNGNSGTNNGAEAGRTA